MIITSKPVPPAKDCTWLIHTDGATYGSNPSMIGSGGFTVWCNGLLYYAASHQQIDTTNNKIEFFALLRALRWAQEFDMKSVHVKSDSDLVVKAMSGEAKLKDPEILRLAGGCKSFLPFMAIRVEWVSREDERQQFTDYVAKLGLSEPIAFKTKAHHDLVIASFYRQLP